MKVDVRYPTHPSEFEHLTPRQLRERFVVEDLFAPGEAHFALSLSDRLVLGGVVPAGATIELPALEELRGDYFLERRELAVVCLQGSGVVNADDREYPMSAEEILYVGKGTRAVSFSGGDAAFYLVSAAAHETLPTVLATRRGRVSRGRRCHPSEPEDDPQVRARGRRQLQPARRRHYHPG